MKPKLIVDWGSYDTAVEQLAERIRLAGVTPGGVMGVPRGGLIAAVMLSHQLDVPFVPFRKDRITSDLLLVDDICDTGHTLSSILGPQDGTEVQYRPLAIGVVVCKPKGYRYLEEGLWELRTFFGMAAATEDWIVFPYEIAETEDGYNGTAG